MTERAPDRIWSSIDIPKTIAGVLAAVSAAVVGSFLGVAGTLIGAAVASFIGSVGTEVYRWWIDRGSRRIQATFVTAPAAVGTPPVAAGDQEPPSELPAPAIVRPQRRLRWGHVALVATGLFVLAMGTLTMFELITGKSAADAVGHQSGSDTTVCSVFCGKREQATPTPAGSRSPTPDETATEPTPTPTTEPTSPAEKAPTTTEPTGTTAPRVATTTKGAGVAPPGGETAPDAHPNQGTE